MGQRHPSTPAQWAQGIVYTWPHLAAHRTLSPGLLAVLAVWHNHHVFTRGLHKGRSPLQLSGMTEAPTDWLVALGYPPDDGAASSVAPPAASPLALAA